MCVVIPIVWSSQVQDLKAKWDGDGNGKLDRAELGVLVQEMRKSMGEQYLNAHQVAAVRAA